MSEKRHSPLDRVLGQLDHLDETNLQNLINRLAGERELFESIINTVREGILVITREGVVEYTNAEGMKMVGLKEACAPSRSAHASSNWTWNTESGAN